MKHSNALFLPGLDGGNMLAFLAALGTLRTLSEYSRIPAQMSWSPSGGTWRPTLHFPQPLDSAELIKTLSDAFANTHSHPETHPCMAWKLWDGEPAARRAAFDTARNSASPYDRFHCDWLSAIGSDLFQPEKETSDTPLRASRNDYLLGNLHTILSTTSPIHLQRALLAPWTYDDPLDNSSLKFDPSEDRRHVFQWSAPTKDRDRKKRGNMLGANRVAVEAIPLFTSTVQENHLATTACRRPPRQDWRVTWCLWSHPVTLDVVRALLTLHEVSKDSPHPATIQELGLCAVFRSKRHTVEKNSDFHSRLARGIIVPVSQVRL